MKKPIRVQFTKKPKKVLLTDNPVAAITPGPYTTVSHVPRPPSRTFTVRVTTQTGAILTVSPSVNQFPTYSFTLDDLDTYTRFTNLFDQYRIDCVTFKLVPMQNAIGLTTNSTTLTVTPYCTIDYDDATAYSSAQQARGNESCIIVAPGMECVRQLQPRMAVAAYSGAFTSYANVPPTWIDCSTPSVQHYGVKLVIPSGVVGQTNLQSWTVEREYTVSFRKVRN